MLFILNAVTVVILLYGGTLVIGGALTIGMLVAFVEDRSQLAAPIRTCGMLVNLATRASSSGERIVEIIDALSEVTESPDARDLVDVRGHVPGVVEDDYLAAHARTAQHARGLAVSIAADLEKRPTRDPQAPAQDTPIVTPVANPHGIAAAAAALVSLGR